MTATIPRIKPAIQPTGSLLCGWYSVINLFRKRNLSEPGLSQLMTISPPNKEGRIGGLTNVAILLNDYGLTATHMVVDDPARVLKLGLPKGLDFIIEHDYFNPGSSTHAVVANQLSPGDNLDYVEVVCSLQGHTTIPLAKMTGHTPGIGCGMVFVI